MGVSSYLELTQGVIPDHHPSMWLALHGYLQSAPSFFHKNDQFAFSIFKKKSDLVTHIILQMTTIFYLSLWHRKWLK
jgi:hypothetical protein